MESGIDSNGDGQLEGAEITQIQFVCNGSPGDAGPPGSQVQVTSEPPGPNCAAGGERIDIGVASGDAGLSPSDIRQTVYVCNGQSVASCLTAVYDDGFEQDSGWTMFEEVVGGNGNCYTTDAGSVSISTDVAAAGLSSLKVWSNEANTLYSDHVIGQKLLYPAGQTGLWSYSLQAYISPSTASTGQTGPEFSVQNTRRGLTTTAGIQYQSNPYVLNDAGTAPADNLAIWTPGPTCSSPQTPCWIPFTELPLQAGQWYTFTLVADFTANAYQSLWIDGPNAQHLAFDLSSYAIAKEMKGFGDAFWLTLESENLWNGCNPAAGPASSQMLVPYQNILYYDQVQVGSCAAPVTSP